MACNIVCTGAMPVEKDIACVAFCYGVYFFGIVSGFYPIAPESEIVSNGIGLDPEGAEENRAGQFIFGDDLFRPGLFSQQNKRVVGRDPAATIITALEETEPQIGGNGVFLLIVN